MQETCPRCGSVAPNWYLKGCKGKKHHRFHDGGPMMATAPTFTDDETALLWCAALRITAYVEGLGEGTEPFLITFTEEDEELSATFRTGRFWDGATRYAKVRATYLKQVGG